MLAESNGKHEAKSVFLSMPTYGGPSVGAARAFFRASTGALHVHLCYHQSSLLNANCNALWAAALNARKDRPLDYFAMLHADVQPPDYWLDLMVAELEFTGLDVLSAVVPIKDRHGLTSTAVGRPDGDPWRPLCRVTMREVFDLPETFTAADCGQPDSALLINTGLFVCKFGDWAEKVHFESRDRIALKEGRYVSQTEPEDWNFARQLHGWGLKVGATRKIPLSHHGFTDYGNTGTWGDWDYDREYLDARTIPEASGWAFPGDVPGWLSEQEGRELARLAKGKRVLEVGSFMGRSTVCLAREAAHVTAVDTFDGRGTPNPMNTMPDFHRAMERHGVAKRVQVKVGTSAEVLPRLSAGGESFGLAFIDGAHDEASVRTDIELSLPLLAPGGLLALHDYGRPDDPGVKAAADALLGKPLSVTGTVALFRPAPAPLAVGV